MIALRSVADAEHAIGRPCQQAAVKQREALLRDLSRELCDAFQLGLRTQFHGNEVLRPGADAVADIVARHHEVLAPLVAPANHDMGMRMTGVEMVNCNPIKLGAEVSLHLLQEIADYGLEIGEAFAVLCRHNEAKLVRIVFGALKKGMAVGIVTGCVIEPTRITLAGDAVALDVAQVRARCSELAALLACVARLDDDAACTGYEQ